MKSVYLIIDNQNRVRSVENKKEKAESDARYLSVSHASRPYRVVRLHFDGPLGFWSGHHLCEAAGIDLHGLRWELDALHSAFNRPDDKTAQDKARTIRHKRNIGDDRPDEHLARLLADTDEARKIARILRAALVRLVGSDNSNELTEMRNRLEKAKQGEGDDIDEERVDDSLNAIDVLLSVRAPCATCKTTTSARSR